MWWCRTTLENLRPRLQRLLGRLPHTRTGSDGVCAKSPLTTHTNLLTVGCCTYAYSQAPLRLAVREERGIGEPLGIADVSFYGGCHSQHTLTHLICHMLACKALSAPPAPVATSHASGAQGKNQPNCGIHQQLAQHLNTHAILRNGPNCASCQPLHNSTFLICLVSSFWCYRGLKMVSPQGQPQYVGCGWVAATNQASHTAINPAN